MAVTQSGLYYTTIRDILGSTQLAVNLLATTNKVAMFTNSITPNFATDTGYTTTGEVSGTGYTAGGLAVASPALDESPSSVLRFDLADTAWTGSTISAARCAELYADALVGKNLIALANFAADYQTVAGTFTIQWASTGFFGFDLF